MQRIREEITKMANIYETQGFNTEQARELAWCDYYQLDNSFFKDPEIPAIDMVVMRRLLQSGVPPATVKTLLETNLLIYQKKS